MSPAFFTTELEGVATFWRIMRKDGVTLGFTSHNRALAFDGINHLAAPGMIPSAIRRTARLERDTVEVQGILSHDAISQGDLESGRYAQARIAVGLVDWTSMARTTLFQGTLGNVSGEGNGFTAELRSAKAQLEQDFVPRTSPTCRAAFGDDRCKVSGVAYTLLTSVFSFDPETNSVSFDGVVQATDYLHGEVRWIDGTHAGMTMLVIDVQNGGLVMDQPIASTLVPGVRAYLREGCDHTINTCSARFGNAVNFQGEPFLPGNDLLARYPTSST